MNAPGALTPRLASSTIGFHRFPLGGLAKDYTMRLLVSVTGAAESVAALAGGADVIDAKDPEKGALGAVSLEVLGEIRAAVDGRRMVTAALGDASDVDALELAAREFAARGADLVKVGFAGIDEEQCVAELIEAAVRGCRAAGDGRSGVVAVAYADENAFARTSVGKSRGIVAVGLVDVAARAGARGVLLDTADKSGAGLTALWTSAELSAWVARAHAHGLIAALAGKLAAEDLPIVRDTGAEIVGVRGAACEGGRSGRVSAHRVRALRP
jgi:(5-formylfuran-3-yl)methyl phosphate synthase